MNDITIAHISDLHLGNDFLLRSLFSWRLFWKTENARLVSGLTTILEELHPDYVVLSGDVVNKSTRRSFRRAAVTLKEMFDKAGIDIPRQVLIVPGNHDVLQRRSQHKYFGRAKKYATFLKDLFGESDFFSRKMRFVRIDVDRKLCIIGLDSTLKVGPASTQKKFWLQWQIADGELGDGQRDWFERKMAHLAKVHSGFEHFVKVVVLHHHPEGIEGAANDDRFMKLIDEVDARKIFHRAGVNVILHGHKHRPYEKQMTFDAESHCTVIGAGTALCAIPGEDAGYGNNFNFIRVQPHYNRIQVQRYKANPDRDHAFEPEGALKERPLFHGAKTGYRVRTLELWTRILDLNGACVDSSRRLGVVVDGPRQPLPQMAFNWSSASAVSKIVGFEHDTESIKSPRYNFGMDTSNPRARQGAFVLKEPLQWGAAPIDLWWTFEVEGAFCMRQADRPFFYPGGSIQQEGIEPEMIHPADVLVLTIDFPRKFWPKVITKCVDENSTVFELPRDAVLQSDRLAGRVTLTIRRPVLRCKYGLWWDIP